MHAVGAEHVRDLVRVGDDGSRAEREHEPRELVRQQLRRLEVHVRVDEARHDETPGRVDDLAAVVVPSPAIQPSAIATSTSSHSRVKTESTRPPRTTTSAGSSPRATARRRASWTASPCQILSREASTLGAVDVLAPRSLDEALQLKAERPDALPIEGGTDVMVELNFDRRRPDALLNLNEVPELKGWSRENGACASPRG